MNRQERAKSTLRVTEEQVAAREFMPPPKKTLVARAPLSEEELTPLFIEFVGKRAAAEIGALLDAGTVKSVGLTRIAAELRKRNCELPLVRTESTAFKEAANLGTTTEKRLDEWVGRGGLAKRYEEVFDATLAALRQSGYEVVGKKRGHVARPQ